MLKSQPAERLLNDLEIWTGQVYQDMQRNWIGKSTGANVTFRLGHRQGLHRLYDSSGPPFWSDLCCFGSEHALVDAITSAEQAQAVADYKHAAISNLTLLD